MPNAAFQDVFPQVLVRHWSPARDEDRRKGVLGFVSVEVAGLVIDGITVRRKADGDLVVAYPRRTTKRGVEVSIVRPGCEEVRLAFEAVILEQLQDWKGRGVAWEQ